jgi:hypothetical protein
MEKSISPHHHKHTLVFHRYRFKTKKAGVSTPATFFTASKKNIMNKNELREYKEIVDKTYLDLTKHVDFLFENMQPKNPDQRLIIENRKQFVRTRISELKQLSITLAQVAAAEQAEASAY